MKRRDIVRRGVQVLNGHLKIGRKVHYFLSKADFDEIAKFIFCLQRLN